MAIENDQAPLKNRIVVDVRNRETGRILKSAFTGAWLIGDENQGETFSFEQEKERVHGHECYAVAQTAGGRLVVLVFDNDEVDCVSLEHYENLDELAGMRDDNVYPTYPRSLVHAIAFELGVELIRELDL